MKKTKIEHVTELDAVKFKVNYHSEIYAKEYVNMKKAIKFWFFSYTEQVAQDARSWIKTKLANETQFPTFSWTDSSFQQFWASVLPQSH